MSELVYWRDPKRSVAVLAAIGLVLFLFQRYSFHSVIIYTAFSVLLATIAFRVFKLLEGYFVIKNRPETWSTFSSHSRSFQEVRWLESIPTLSGLGSHHSSGQIAISCGESRRSCCLYLQGNASHFSGGKFSWFCQSNQIFWFIWLI